MKENWKWLQNMQIVIFERESVIRPIACKAHIVQKLLLLSKNQSVVFDHPHYHFIIHTTLDRQYMQGK